MTIKHQIKAYITTEIAPDVTASELPDGYNLIDNGVLNSLAIVRLIAWLGATYQIPINDLDLAPADFVT
jgi:acyl carrier protein